jgi:hypothetical protein
MMPKEVGIGEDKIVVKGLSKIFNSHNPQRVLQMLDSGKARARYWNLPGPRSVFTISTSRSSKVNCSY